MPSADINFVAVVIAAVAAIGLGFLWYSPMVLGKSWIKEMGLTDEKLKGMKKNMGPMYGLSFLGSLVMAYVLAHIIDYTLASDWMSGAVSGFWMWLGFVGPVQMNEVIFGNKSWNLYYINTGYQLVSLLLMGAILATWI